MKFKYESFGDGKDQFYYPVLNLKIVNPKNKTVSPPYKVLVDSGASASIFHSSIAESIGIEVLKGEKQTFSGVTEGKGTFYLHDVIILIGGHSEETRLGFSYDLKSWFGLLGQKGFFEKNRICFDLPKGDFEITPKSHE